MSGAGRSNDNAYIERLWRTLKYEYLKIRTPKTVADYKDLLPKFIRWYRRGPKKEDHRDRIKVLVKR